MKYKTSTKSEIETKFKQFKFKVKQMSCVYIMYIYMKKE